MHAYIYMYVCMHANKSSEEEITFRGKNFLSG